MLHVNVKCKLYQTSSSFSSSVSLALSIYCFRFTFHFSPVNIVNKTIKGIQRIFTSVPVWGQ